MFDFAESIIKKIERRVLVRRVAITLVLLVLVVSFGWCATGLGDFFKDSSNLTPTNVPLEPTPDWQGATGGWIPQGFHPS